LNELRRIRLLFQYGEQWSWGENKENASTCTINGTDHKPVIVALIQWNANGIISAGALLVNHGATVNHDYW
jgi:hypothetical protein